MAGADMLVVKGCKLEIVTDTTAAITNSTAEKQTECTCARVHVGVSIREYACVDTTLMGERGWEEAGGRGTLYGEKQSDGERQNNYRRSAGWWTLGVFSHKMTAFPSQSKGNYTSTEEIYQRVRFGDGLGTRNSGKQITAMLCAHERACFVLPPQMDCTFRTGGTSLLFLKREIMLSGEGGGDFNLEGSEDKMSPCFKLNLKKKSLKGFFLEMTQFCQFSTLNNTPLFKPLVNKPKIIYTIITVNNHLPWGIYYLYSLKRKSLWELLSQIPTLLQVTQTRPRKYKKQASSAFYWPEPALNKTLGYILGRPLFKRVSHRLNHTFSTCDAERQKGKSTPRTPPPPPPAVSPPSPQPTQSDSPLPFTLLRPRKQRHICSWGKQGGKSIQCSVFFVF